MVSEIQCYFANFDDQWLLAGIGSRGYFQVAGLIMAAPLARVREMDTIRSSTGEATLVNNVRLDLSYISVA